MDEDEDTSTDSRDESGIVREAHARLLRLAFEREQQNESLRESEERFRAAFDSAPIGMALVAPDGHFLQVNHSLCRMLGYEGSELLALTSQDITHPDDLSVDLTLVQQVLDGEIETYNLEKRYIHRDGYIVWILLTVAPVRDRQGQPFYFISQIQDITRTKAADIALRENEARLARILETVDEPIVIFNAQGRLVMANDEAERVLGVNRKTNLGRHYDALGWTLTRSDDSPLPINEGPVAMVLRTRERVRQFEARFSVEDRSIDCLVNASPLLNAEGEFDGVVATVHDITRRKQLEDELRHRAMHDTLTGLPNRTLFLDRAHQALASARRNGRSVAVLYLDLDNFKPVNDTWGHATGDDLLMQVAERLELVLREDDTAARIGGDEFAVLLRSITPDVDIREIGERLLAALSRPIHLDGAGNDAVLVTPSIGIAISKGGNDDPSDLLRLADAAMYQAKRAGKHTVAIYNDASDIALD